MSTCACTHAKLDKTSFFFGQILNPKTSIFFGTEGVGLFDLLSTGYVRSRYDCQIGVLLPPSLTSAADMTCILERREHKSIFILGHVYMKKLISRKKNELLALLAKKNRIMMSEQIKYKQETPAESECQNRCFGPSTFTLS
jgi:hypothetical protein